MDFGPENCSRLRCFLPSFKYLPAPGLTGLELRCFCDLLRVSSCKLLSCNTDELTCPTTFNSYPDIKCVFPVLSILAPLDRRVGRTLFLRFVDNGPSGCGRSQNRPNRAQSLRPSYMRTVMIYTSYPTFYSVQQDHSFTIANLSRPKAINTPSRRLPRARQLYQLTVLSSYPHDRLSPNAKDPIRLSPKVEIPSSRQDHT